MAFDGDDGVVMMSPDLTIWALIEMYRTLDGSAPDPRTPDQRLADAERERENRRALFPMRAYTL